MAGDMMASRFRMKPRIRSPRSCVLLPRIIQPGTMKIAKTIKAIAPKIILVLVCNSGSQKSEFFKSSKRSVIAF